MKPIIRLILVCPLLLLTLGAARAPILVPDVSQRTIDIQYSFTGAELLLFGAIVYPDGRAPKDKPAIVVVLKGPPETIYMREKQKVAGIWLNADAAQFRSAPAYYAVASSAPLADLVDERTAAIYEMGVDKLQLSPSSLNDADEIRRFEAGLVDLRRRAGLFVEAPGTVEITADALYRARLPLPARVVTGTYTAETFLVQNGRVLAAATRDIQIRKSGFERFVAMAADEHSLLYGISAIILAIFLGWCAGTIARRV